MMFSSSKKGLGGLLLVLGEPLPPRVFLALLAEQSTQ